MAVFTWTGPPQAPPLRTAAAPAWPQAAQRTACCCGRLVALQSVSLQGTRGTAGFASRSPARRFSSCWWSATSSRQQHEDGRVGRDGRGEGAGRRADRQQLCRSFARRARLYERGRLRKGGDHARHSLRVSGGDPLGVRTAMSHAGFGTPRTDRESRGDRPPRTQRWCSAVLRVALFAPVLPRLNSCRTRSNAESQLSDPHPGEKR